MSLVSRTIVGAGIALAVTSILMPQPSPETGAPPQSTHVESGPAADARTAPPDATAAAPRGRLDRTATDRPEAAARPTRAEILRGLVSLQLLQSR
jgi:hypothetical protein